MDLLTKQEFARVWRVSAATVDKWIAAGKVRPIYTPGGSPRFPRPSLEELRAQGEPNP